MNILRSRYRTKTKLTANERKMIREWMKCAKGMPTVEMIHILAELDWSTLLVDEDAEEFTQKMTALYERELITIEEYTTLIECNTED